MTWPQNAGKHISEDHNCNSFPGKRLQLQWSGGGVCTLKPPTGDSLGMSVSRTPFYKIPYPLQKRIPHPMYILLRASRDVFFYQQRDVSLNKEGWKQIKLIQWVTKVLRHLAVKFDFWASWKYYPSPRTKSDFNQGMRSATITEGSASCESTEWYNTLPAESARCVCFFLLSVFLGKIYVTQTAMRRDKSGQAKRFCFSWIV